MSAIPNFFKNAVVALGVRPMANKDAQWIGTGFIVGKKDPNDPRGTYLYLVTNRHVVINYKSMTVCVNKADGTGVLHLSVNIYDLNGKPCCSMHPQRDVDVVAMELNASVLVNAKGQINWFDIDDHALTLAKMKQSGVDEGCLVYALGFPMGIVNQRIKAPFLRLGCISRIEDAFRGIGDSSYYVDAQTFPGNSGGPVVNRPANFTINGTPSNSSSNLIGILSSYLPYREPLASRQTNEVMMVHRENSGLTKVFPVERIVEVVEMEFKRIHGNDLRR